VPLTDHVPSRDVGSDPGITPPGTPDPKPRDGKAPGTQRGRVPRGLGRSRLIAVALLLLLANWFLSAALLAPGQPQSVTYSTFRSELAGGNVTSVSVQSHILTGKFRQSVSVARSDTSAAPAKSAGTIRVTAFRTVEPDIGDSGLMPLLLSQHVAVTGEPAATTPLLFRVLLGFGPTLLLIGGLLWLATRGLGGTGGIGQLSRSKAKLYTAGTGPRVTFADVAGIDEVKAEVAEVVDFLRRPGHYRALGATIPKGVLLAGLPGTGKTLLARAVAGEARVPFFSVSAAEFVEMIVGVGASRVRDLFAQAKKAAPAIIFIDELDAIGAARGSRSIGGHDEQGQTLNQILTEMDGFSGTEGVVVLAATNRPEVLDPALMRPGRFDRQITVDPPDRGGRVKILTVHTRNLPLGPDVDLVALAASTPGTVGADLRNLVNEAALNAARRGASRVAMCDFTDAVERTLLGAARGIVLSPEEKLRTAYHEAGHALVGMLTAGADPIRKVSIIPRGHALGVTFSTPDEDRYGFTRPYLRGRIVGALAGSAAEDVVYGETSSGAESDLAQASRLARSMVTRWGMSPALGPVALEGVGADQFDDGPLSEGTRTLIDTEVRNISESCYAEAVALLTDHRQQLDKLARRLLDVETLDGPGAYHAAGLSAPSTSRTPPPAPATR
jgi:cell division protease FtsH